MKQWKSPDFNELNIQDTCWLDDLFDDDFIDDDIFEDWQYHCNSIGNVIHHWIRKLGGNKHNHSNPTDCIS